MYNPKSELEYTEHGWRYTLDSRRHHRERRWNYRGEGIYHFTLTTCERYPLFGKLAGESQEEAYVDLNNFGKEVLAILRNLLVEPHPNLFEQPEVIAQTTAKTGDIPHDALRYRFVALNVIASLLAPSHE